MSKVFTEACAQSFDTPKRSLLPAYRVERSFDLSGPANAGGQEHPQAVTADSGKTGRLDYHLTTLLSSRFRLSFLTFQHSFITITNSAGICAYRTNSRAVSLYSAGCHSSPTRKAAGSNPVSRTKKARAYVIWARAFAVVWNRSRRGPPYNPITSPSFSWASRFFLSKAWA